MSKNKNWIVREIVERSFRSSDTERRPEPGRSGRKESFR